MTKTEFAKGWAERNGIKVGDHQRRGQFPARCTHCDDEACPGWQMVGAGSMAGLLGTNRLQPSDVPEWAWNHPHQVPVPSSPPHSSKCMCPKCDEVRYLKSLELRR